MNAIVDTLINNLITKKSLTFPVISGIALFVYC